MTNPSRHSLSPSLSLPLRIRTGRKLSLGFRHRRSDPSGWWYSARFALDDIESYLKREHGERRPTDDRGSRQDQKRRHLNLSNVAFAANHQQT